LYLPTSAELNLLCQWNRGVAPDVTTSCSGGSINSATYGAGAAGFYRNGEYWSSSEYDKGYAWDQDFNGGVQGISFKDYDVLYVRPVRAF